MIITRENVLAPGKASGQESNLLPATTINSEVLKSFAEDIADALTEDGNRGLNYSYKRQLKSLMFNKRLSAGEIKVLDYVGDGATNEEIAHAMNTSERAVKLLLFMISLRFDTSIKNQLVNLA